MPPENWFQKNTKFGSAPIEDKDRAAVPDGLAVKCSGCGEILFNKDFEKNLKVCSKCGHHHRMSVDERIAALFDEGTFEEINVPIRSRDFLKFPDYQDKLDKGWAKSGNNDSFRIGIGKIQGQKCVAGLSEFSFMGGSMGSVAGEKITRAIETGVRLSLPVVLVATSGGARMQEGLMSLMQMAKTAAAAARLAKARLPLFIVLTDPTTAGVMASYASLGDVLISEPGALVAFTGQRVAAQAAQGQKLPANYQTAEWRLERGHIDLVLHRKELATTLGRLLGLLYNPAVAVRPARTTARSTARAKAGVSSESSNS
ncbi:MAG: acetyl-CoA carboxylase carboxyltransferase subunit beta [Capsulimonadaceae bacterium]|nr:acetyl-CoA carboxylase carboxyltransferase subunit beta [Capsulimonadaceae bacterium]